MVIKFTPTQQRIMTLLQDGRGHTVEELAGCLGDDMAVNTTVSAHLTLLRRVLRPHGQDVICQRGGARPLYFLARLLANPNDGKR